MDLIPFMILYVLNALFNSALGNSEGVTEDCLSAVSSSAGSEKFYLEMKRLHNIREPRYDNQENTHAICEAVLNSAHFFYHHEVRPVRLTDERVQKRVKQNFSTIYTDLYPAKSFRSFFGGEMKSNLYMERTVSHLGEDIQEYVFACAAKRRRLDALEIYFISYEYDFGCMTDADFRKNNLEKLTGRFVFEYEEKKGRINLIALAENPTSVFSLTPRSKSLFREAFVKDIRRNARCDHLTSSEKLRLCSVVLNGKAYRGVVNFLSRKEDVSPQCENVNLVLYGMQGHANGFEFENETVFKCTAEFIGHSTPPVIFFISAGDEHHKFFISRQEGNKTVIQKYFYSYNLGSLP